MPKREEVVYSFGKWVQKRRKALGLTQEALRLHVCCAEVTIRKIEADTMRPSHQMAERLADCLDISAAERNVFIKAARGERCIDQLGPPQTDIEIRPLINNQTHDQGARSASHNPVSPYQATALSSAPPTFQVPYPPNPLFVGREHELERLAALLDSNETIAVVPAIAGTGGIGKTMLAAEFAHRNRDHFEGGIFWLNMEDPEGVASQVATCAGPGGLHLAGYEGWSFDDRIAAVKSAWQQPDRRLLILDNLEDPKLLHWRPSSGGCRVLITTRRASWSARSGVRAVPLDTLARPDSLHVLLTPRYGSFLPDNPAADAICEALGDLPLALALASAYLEHYPSVALADYAAQIRSNPVAHESLNAVLEEGLPTAHATSTVTTFSLSYQRLQTDDPIDVLARTLLHRAAYCAPVAIPHKLLAYTDATEQEATTYQRNVDAALHRLLAVGLLDDLGSAGLRLHRLLAAFARSRTPNPDLEQRWVAQTLSTLLEAILEAGYPQAGSPYLEHARHTTNVATDNTAHAGLLNNLGHLLHEIGDLEGARPYLERALEVRERVLGPDHPDTAQSLNNLGWLLRDMADTVSARPYLERALTIREHILGTDHPDTAESLNDLGNLLRSLGDLTAARPYLERALAIREHILGTDHPDTAESLNNMGMLLRSLGDLTAARPYLERALAIREHILDPDHPDTALSLNNLGMLLRSLGDLTAARPYLERALEVRERILGPDHPDTTQSLNNLGNLLQDIGDLTAARPYLERALAIRERVLGPNHPHTATSLNNLGWLLRDMGDLTAARPYLERALAIRERVLGPNHPHITSSLSNLGNLLQEMGDLTAARPYLEHALSTCERVLGPDHFHTATSLDNLGWLLKDMGDLTAARPYLERALATRERVLGPDHPHTATSLNNLGALLQEMGNLTAARSYLEGALDIYERVLGPNHPNTARSLNNLGTLLYSMGELAAARPYLERAFTISEKILGPEHPQTSRFQNNLLTLDTAQPPPQADH